MKLSELIEKGYNMPNVHPLKEEDRGYTFWFDGSVIYCCPIGAAALACGYVPGGSRRSEAISVVEISEKFPDIGKWLHSPSSGPFINRWELINLFDDKGASVEEILNWLRQSGQ